MKLPVEKFVPPESTVITRCGVSVELKKIKRRWYICGMPRLRERPGRHWKFDPDLRAWYKTYLGTLAEFNMLLMEISEHLETNLDLSSVEAREHDATRRLDDSVRDVEPNWPIWRQLIAELETILACQTLTARGDFGLVGELNRAADTLDEMARRVLPADHRLRNRFLHSDGKLESPLSEREPKYIATILSKFAKLQEMRI